MKKIAFSLVLIVFFIPAIAQINAGLYRYPDVSKTQIVFTYANDLWVIPKQGGEAIKLSSPAGGPSDKLPLAYGEFASYSADGNELALTFRTQAFRNWKRYRGGWKADIHIFNLSNNTSENITALN